MNLTHKVAPVYRAHSKKEFSQFRSGMHCQQAFPCRQPSVKSIFSTFGSLLTGLVLHQKLKSGRKCKLEDSSRVPNGFFPGLIGPWTCFGPKYFFSQKFYCTGPLSLRASRDLKIFTS